MTGPISFGTNCRPYCSSPFQVLPTLATLLSNCACNLGKNQLTNAADFSARASQAKIDAITSADSSANPEKKTIYDLSEPGQQIKLAASKALLFFFFLKALRA